MQILRKLGTNIVTVEEGSGSVKRGGIFNDPPVQTMYSLKSTSLPYLPSISPASLFLWYYMSNYHIVFQAPIFVKDFLSRWGSRRRMGKHHLIVYVPIPATLLIDFTNAGDLECRLQRCNVQRWGPVPPKQELCCNVVCLVDIVQCTRQDFALDFALK